MLIDAAEQMLFEFVSVMPELYGASRVAQQIFIRYHICAKLSGFGVPCGCILHSGLKTKMVTRGFLFFMAK